MTGNPSRFIYRIANRVFQSHSGVNIFSLVIALCVGMLILSCSFTAFNMHAFTQYQVQPIRVWEIDTVEMILGLWAHRDMARAEICGEGKSQTS